MRVLLPVCKMPGESCVEPISFRLWFSSSPGGSLRDALTFSGHKGILWQITALASHVVTQRPHAGNTASKSSSSTADAGEHWTRQLAFSVLCLTLCDPVHCSPARLLRPNSPGRNTRVGCHALLQGIFPTQGLDLHLPHCQANSSPQSHQERFLGKLPGKWIYF